MIRLDGVTKRYAAGAPPAVDNVDLTVREGEIMMLIGPSGCGKTTTLRMINRLIEPTSGRIFLNGDDVTDVDPVALRRHVGYVIQQVGLFPHLSVGENIATVPRLLRWDRHRIDERVTAMLDMVRLDHTYAKRYPSELSGGQRQRVGVARALAADPPVLLMDEPFGAIDPITRTELQDEFVRMQAELSKTIVFVTHDLDEAVRLGDRIALFATGGTLVQVDTPDRLLGSPDGDFATSFVGADRGLRRLEVTTVDRSHLVEMPRVTATDSPGAVTAAIDGNTPAVAVVLDAAGRFVGSRAATDPERVRPESGRAAPSQLTEGRTTLREAMAALLLDDEGWLPVADDDGRFLGALTPDAIHRATRDSLDEAASADRASTAG
ncbi:MAG TPA: ATP-binding cassette domain-containing protein [Acidimicrobiales bacterium]|nr:ATP-binding cassette domain-containing protein [Acidimicrobiales bacterium]